MSTPSLAFHEVSKAYHSASGQPLNALHPTTFAIEPGRTIAIIGRSGSGKSTLLHLAAGIDIPTGGEVTVHGRSLNTLDELARTRLRRDEIGLVFQFFHLLSHLSVRDNVALPELIAGGRLAAATPRVHDLLDRVGLGDRAGDRIDQLSGGEMQRIAICRALLRKPKLLLADEPTGNLDDETGRAVMDLMLALARDEGSTLVFVTHSTELASRADETWTLHSGRLDIP
jgi:ABC-type lipoprotein export system ATPase subunit